MQPDLGLIILLCFTNAFILDSWHSLFQYPEYKSIISVYYT